MKFFSKIKEDLEHGGIRVTMQAAESISHKDPTLPVSINITNTEKVKHIINQVFVEVQATENNSAYGMVLNNTVQTGNTTNNNEMYNMETLILAKSQSTEIFTLQPNESKTITLDITVNNTSIPSNSIMGSIASTRFGLNHYKYKLYSRVDVDDIELDPHAHQDLKIL